MHIKEYDPAVDADKVRAWYQLYAECEPVDAPGSPVQSEHGFCTAMRLSWPGFPQEPALATDGDGTCVGGYVLDLPERENRHQAGVTVLVALGHRRSGLGTRLLRAAAGRAAAHGRGKLTAETRTGMAGSAFAASKGARPGLIEVRRALDLADAPAARLAELRAGAEQAAKGYSLLCWQGKTPEEYLAQLVTVANAMADAPRNPGEEAWVEDEERTRQVEHNLTEMGRRFYSVAARCDATGEIVAWTNLNVDPLVPAWGFQGLTAVTRPHRGHRLGMLVKVAMLDMLVEAEPDLRHIMTGNAGTNKHMISINDEIGFRVFDEWQSWELDVADVAGA